jgi:hypothetical protein
LAAIAFSEKKSKNEGTLIRYFFTNLTSVSGQGLGGAPERSEGFRLSGVTTVSAQATPIFALNFGMA